MKYELSKNTKDYYGTTLYQIKSLKDFGLVKAGDLGGWVKSKKNLSQEGKAWVYDYAKVYGNANTPDGTQEPYWDEMKRKLREEAEIDISEEIEKVKDNVNHPAHYGNGSIECIDYIEDFLNPDEFQGYLRGNIAKYLHRWPYKNGTEDLYKAKWYLNKLIETKEKAK